MDIQNDQEKDLDLVKVEEFLRKSKGGVLEAFIPRKTGVSKEKLFQFIEEGKIVRKNGYVYVNTPELQAKIENENRKKEALRNISIASNNNLETKKSSQGSKLVEDLKSRRNYQR